MSITDCKHRHHHSPEGKQLYKEYSYQLCKCLGCDRYFVQVLDFNSSTMTHHVVYEETLKETTFADKITAYPTLAKQWIDSHS